MPCLGSEQSIASSTPSTRRSNLPVITIGGIAKQYLCPGWRLGWATISNDPMHRLAQVRQGMISLSQTVLGPNTLVQAALPAILLETPPSYYAELNATLENQAKSVCDIIEQRCPGLCVIKPQGAMYLMVRIDIERFPSFSDDRQFAEALIAEQQVVVLPGACFQAPNFFRIVFCAPESVLSEAVERIGEFCAKHVKA